MPAGAAAQAIANAAPSAPAKLRHSRAPTVSDQIQTAEATAKNPGMYSGEFWLIPWRQSAANTKALSRTPGSSPNAPRSCQLLQGIGGEEHPQEQCLGGGERRGLQRSLGWAKQNGWPQFRHTYSSYPARVVTNRTKCPATTQTSGWRMTRRGCESFRNECPQWASVLLKSFTRGDTVDAMSEQAAEIPHLFLEKPRRRIRVSGRGKKQWVSALNADVLVVPSRSAMRHLGVVAEEAGQRVTHARIRFVGSQVPITATAPPSCITRFTKHMVVYVMAPNRA